jgi:hypothetical protein
MKPLTPEYTEQILQQIAEFPPDAEEAAIHETADRLKAMNWQPTLLAGPPDFLTITRDQLKAFIEQLTAGRNDLTEPHLNLLLYHYRLLRRLRDDEPEAWDEVNELMEDD